LPGEVFLKVAEAYHNDSGKGIVRIDEESRRQIGANVGDVVEIAGRRSTGAIVAEAYPDDRGLGIIRMDGLIRRNAKTSIGEKVRVRRINAKEARKVVISPVVSRGGVWGFREDILLRNLMGRAVAKRDLISIVRPGRYREGPPPLALGEMKFLVVSTVPSGIVRITRNTRIEVSTSAKPQLEIPEVTYEDIGGLKEELQRVREMIELPLKHPELFNRLGIEPPKGVLLHGPPGTGKTLIAKAVANEADAYFISINGPEIMSKFYGESEQRLREVFREAEENSPAIIFIDELDAIAPKREEVTGEVERRVVAQLLALMDGLESRGQVIVIGATNRPNAIDPALRRPGRFDREIEIGVPDKEGRKEILQIHTRGMPLSEDVDLEELAEVTHGFVGADLEALCKEAAMHALRRVLPEINLDEETIPPEVLEKLKVTKEDFKAALRVVQPSAMREVLVEVPRVKWEDVGGLEEVKQELREVVEWPLNHKEAFERMGITPPKGILLYGPPGSGKTLLAKAVANESEANFISVKGPEILSKWVGESERAIREIFRRARQVSPAIVFFDEIDAIAPRRGMGGDSQVTERIISQLLTEMDGLEELEDVVVLAATNRPDMLDPALLRPGRFDRLIYVPPPDKEARRKIFEVHTRGMPLGEDVSLDELAERTEGYTGADIAALCREAAMRVLSQGKVSEVRMRHFEEAMKEIKGSLDSSVMQIYETINKRVVREIGQPELTHY